ncbi:hypothetical protein [Streptomyces sp. NPDC059142]|uniref:hypothetical protein n=1 Tax=Streptomyces sp. NPDC059142 TaxID=3346739 RepID=UPI00367896A6
MRGFVAHFVAVDWAGPYGTGPWAPVDGTVLALPGRALVARTAPARAAAGWCAPPLDEHLAVDADACRDPRRLECADVLQTGRARPADGALRWLAEIRAAHPGARLVAAPLPGGGWVAAGADGDRCAVLPPRGTDPRRTRPGWSLVPSCLHGWLVAGHSLRELCEPREPYELREPYEPRELCESRERCEPRDPWDPREPCLNRPHGKGG